MSTEIGFTLTLTMTSDWHVGSGVGRQGSVDSLVIRDADDLPYAPSSTVAGMWRDAAEQLAFGLDQTCGGGKWTDLVPSLFGDQPAIGNGGGMGPVPSRLALEHLRLPRDLRAALRGASRASLRQELTFVKPGVRIDPRRGTAATDMLRFEEISRSGAILIGRSTIDTAGIANTQHHDTLAAFAFASLRLLERIGGGRRRGLGRCDAQVADVSGTTVCDVEAALEHLRGLSEGSIAAAPAIEPLRVPTSEHGSFDACADGDLVEVPLQVEALSPLLVMDQRLGNVTTCLDHVPGTMLLPIVSRALQDAGVEPTKVTQLITSGALTVAPGYATIGSARGLPMPMRWQWKKQDGTERTKTVANADSERTADDAVQRVHPTGGEFVADGKFRRVSHVVRTHNTVSDAVQKPAEDVGGVYTYEAIRPGERLASVVRLPESLGAEVLRRFRCKVTGRARVGAVTRRGYGDVTIEAGKSRPVSDRGLQQSDSAVLWLTSDLCLPAPMDSSLPSIYDQAPDVRSQVAAAIGRAVGRSVTVVRSWLRTRRHESWHRQWGLPRPSLTLVRAGSTIVVKPSDENGCFGEEDLALLERRGAGERRAEGYGQLRVNAGEVTRPGSFPVSTYRSDVEDRSDEPMEEIEPSSTKFACTIEDAAWRSYIAMCAEEATATDRHRECLLGWKRERPSASQLGKMRGLLNGARTDEDVDAVRRWLCKKPKGWDGAGAKLIKVLDDPFAVLATQRDRDWRSAPSALTRSLCDILKDKNLKRYATAAIVHAALRAHRRSAETRSSASGDRADEEQEIR